MDGGAVEALVAKSSAPCGPAQIDGADLATMLEAITVTSLSRRIWALVCSAMISRRRRRRTRGPPPVGINQSRLNRNDYVSGRIQLIGGMKRRTASSTYSRRSTR